jgi:hypothetical protein
MKTAKAERGRFYFFLFAFVLTVGCTAVKEYRTGVEPIYYDHYDQQTPLAGKDLTNVIEVATNYTLGFVEFDDQGWLYDAKKTAGRSQIDIVTQRISQELQTNGVLLVVFIHGWKHNARWDDENVAMFHNVLQKLGNIELQEPKPARRVFGVYVGWRGLSMTTPVLYDLSFFGRKSTAERVGHGAVIQLLSDLEALRDESNLTNAATIAANERASTKLITMGHSFGGDVLYSASAPVLTERMEENYDGEGNERPPNSLGDLVVLINPAFEAARFETLQRLGKAINPSLQNTNCTLAVFTSTGDSATGFWFPVGRDVSTVFQRYSDRHAQRAANIAAVGHYTPYINYDLKPMKQDAGEKIAEAHVKPKTEDYLSTIKAVKEQMRTNWLRGDRPYDFTNSNCRLIPTNCTAGDPVFNVRVSPAIIPNHDDIDTTNFQAFLVDFFSTFAHGGK